MALGKHKYYCEICQKQCRDENAYRQHKATLFHKQKMTNFSERPDFYIEKYSKQFRSQFINVLEQQAGCGVWVVANKVYQEQIKEVHHVHLNATKWPSLTEFVSDLCQEEVFETQNDDSPVPQVMIRRTPQSTPEPEPVINFRELERKRESKMIRKQVERAQKLKQPEREVSPSQGRSFTGFSFESAKAKPT